MKPRSTTVKALLAVAVGAVSLSTPLGAAAQEREAILQDWDARLKEIRQRLDDGQWPEVRERADGLIDELVRRLVGGEDDAELLAAVVTYRAIAEVGLGEDEDAAWSWIIAQNLDPAMREAPLEGFGRAGELFAHHRLREPGEPQPGITPLDEPGITPPRKLSGEPPILPSPLAERGGDRVIVGTTVGVDGRPRDPVVLAGRYPVAGFLALQALSEWRFEPARRNGEPLAVVVELTVPFAPEAPREKVDSWRRRLEEMDRFLSAGRWRAAARGAEDLADEIAAEAGLGGTDLLARAVAGQALADAGRGRTGDAVWTWYVAQNLARELRWADLSAYGSAGELLAAHPLRRPGERADGTPAAEPAALGLGPLRRIRGQVPEYPEPYALAVPVVETVLDHGRPESPVVLSIHPPAVVLAALRALRDWRMEPPAGRPTVRRVAVPSVTIQPPESQSNSRLLGLARMALGAGETAIAECYRGYASGRGGPGREIEPIPVGERWPLDRPSRSSPDHDDVPGGPVMVGGEVKKPVRIHSPSAQYNVFARKARIEGVVIVQTIVDRAGNVRNAAILKRMPMGLDHDTVESVCRFKFEPATLNGRPVGVYYNLTMNFTIQ